MKEQRGCEIRITSQLDMFATLPLTQLCLSGMQTASMHKGENSLWCFSFFLCNLCPLLLKGTEQCRRLTAGVKMIRSMPSMLINVAMCGLILKHLHMLSADYFTQRHPTYCVFICLPCWAGLLSSDFPSICLSRLMNGKKSICFLRRWWPTAEGKSVLQ